MLFLDLEMLSPALRIPILKESYLLSRNTETSLDTGNHYVCVLSVICHRFLFVLRAIQALQVRANNI